MDVEFLAKRERMFGKIRGLLRKAESTPFEEENRTFVTKAQELMRSYSIMEAELWSREPDRTPTPTTLDIQIEKGVGRQQKMALLATVGHFNRCIVWSTKEGKNMQATIAGYESDALFVEMLYTSLISYMRFEMAKGQAISEEDGRTFRINFMNSFNRTIWKRLDEFEKQNETGMELVSLRKEKVATYVDSLGFKFSRTRYRSTAKRSEGANLLGELAGKNADISGGQRSAQAGEKRGEIS